MFRSAAMPRLLAVGVITAAVLALAAHASLALGGGYLNYVSGIWLALGRDLHGGVFYRDLINDAGYGGTRYFPLFFIVIAGFMRAGAGVLTAGWLASAVSAVVLVTGMFRLVRALGGGRLLAGVFAAGAIAPYFVQQTLFEVRADVLAAALNVWGLAFLLPEWGANPDRRAQPTLSALCFTLALATKVTSLAIPFAVLFAALVAGRRTLAVGVLWRLTLGAVLFLVCVYWVSDGRAIASWRACMFAGTGAGGTFGSLLGGDFLRLTRYSRLLAALFIVTTSSLIAAAVLAARGSARKSDGRALLIPVGLFVGATVSTGMALSSPGTVPSNQMVEWIEIMLAILALLTCTRPAMTRVLAAVAGALVLWTSAQDVRTTRDMWDTRLDSVGSTQVQALIEQVASAPGPVLSESALWPLLAGTPVYLLDPFALRVVMQSRSDIERDLMQKIDRHVFPLVIFQVDPTTVVGRGYYQHVNFGWPVTERILDRYRFAGHPRGDVYLYVPRESDAPGGPFAASLAGSGR